MHTNTSLLKILESCCFGLKSAFVGGRVGFEELEFVHFCYRTQVTVMMCRDTDTRVLVSCFSAFSPACPCVGISCGCVFVCVGVIVCGSFFLY